MQQEWFSTNRSLVLLIEFSTQNFIVVTSQCMLWKEKKKEEERHQVKMKKKKNINWDTNYISMKLLTIVLPFMLYTRDFPSVKQARILWWEKSTDITAWFVAVGIIMRSFPSVWRGKAFYFHCAK